MSIVLFSKMAGNSVISIRFVILLNFYINMYCCNIFYNTLPVWLYRYHKMTYHNPMSSRYHVL